MALDVRHGEGRGGRAAVGRGGAEGQQRADRKVWGGGGKLRFSIARLAELWPRFRSKKHQPPHPPPREYYDYDRRSKAHRGKIKGPRPIPQEVRSKVGSFRGGIACAGGVKSNIGRKEKYSLWFRRLEKIRGPLKGAHVGRVKIRTL